MTPLILATLLGCSPPDTFVDGTYLVSLAWAQDRDWDTTQGGPTPSAQQWVLFQESEDALKIDTYVQLESGGPFEYVATANLARDEELGWTWEQAVDLAMCGDLSGYQEIVLTADATAVEPDARRFTGIFDEWWQPHSCPTDAVSGDASCTCEGDALERRFAFDLSAEWIEETP